MGHNSGNHGRKRRVLRHFLCQWCKAITKFIQNWIIIIHEKVLTKLLEVIDINSPTQVGQNLTITRKYRSWQTQ